MHNTSGEWTEHDIRNAKGTTIPWADIWTAGFPCTDISKNGKQKDLQEKNQDYLQKLSGSSKKYLNIRNLPTCSLKTLITHYQSIKDGTLPVFSLKWMESGMMRNGMLSPQQRLESLKEGKRIFIAGYLRGSGVRRIFS